MTALVPVTLPLDRPFDEIPVDDAEHAATAFLARYQGRTLDAYRYAVRAFFQWAADQGLEVLKATRSQIELYVQSMEERGLVPPTIDRRRRPSAASTASPASMAARPELGAFFFVAERFDHAHTALAVLLGLNALRVSEACPTEIENLGFERGHRALRIVGNGSKPTMIPLVPRTARTTDLAIGERPACPILLRRDGDRLDRRTAHRCVRSIGKATRTGQVHPHLLRTDSIMCALDAGVPL